MSIHVSKNKIRATGSDANSIFNAFREACEPPKPEFTDTERLEWLIVKGVAMDYCEGDGKEWFVSIPKQQRRYFDSPREAIDDAMRREAS